MPEYRATTHIPSLVRQALALAQQMGFSNSCSPETGRLLHVLASQHRSGPIAEIGTGCGVGAAWIVSALAPEATFVTVEVDGERAEAVRTLFEAYPNVRVLEGDWHDILPYGPFDMVFVDVKAAKQQEAALVLGALKVGGLAVLDDLTPEEQWPQEWRGRPDPVRDFWLNDPRLASTEILVTPNSMVILATRVK